MIISSDSDYANTISGDERVENMLKECRRKRRLKAEEIETHRKKMFEDFYNREIQNADSFLNLPAFNFCKYTHQKIKFSFTPSLINDVSKRYIFYCTLWYKLNFWRIKRDTFPRDVKPLVSKWFYLKKSPNDKRFTGVNDSNVNGIIYDIYKVLEKWVEKERQFRLKRYNRYKKGEDIELDSIEEEMFLNEDEINEIHEKRNKILRRMIPPDKVNESD